MTALLDLQLVLNATRLATYPISVGLNLLENSLPLHSLQLDTGVGTVEAKVETEATN